MLGKSVLTAILATAGPIACSAGAESALPAQPGLRPIGTRPDAAFVRRTLPTPIRHVVIVFQENRTPDFLFQGIPGADIRDYGIDRHGKPVPLEPVSLASGYDLEHSHTAFLRDYDGGKMDGFNRGMTADPLRPFKRGIEAEVKPYHEMALQYVLGDNMFQTNQGPSFPAHMYIVSGSGGEPAISGYLVEDNPYKAMTGRTEKGGCDARPGVVVRTISVANGTEGPPVSTCFERPVLSDFLDENEISWRYYQDELGPGLWHAMDDYHHVRYGKDYANVVTPSQTILQDIKDRRLAGVSWVMPNRVWSDHAGRDAQANGPAWVAAIVNAIGKSRYWKDTAILVAWDDWGGWYDHVPPPVKNDDELGFRVPLLVISPYARAGYVSKVEHEFGSILAFTEVTFGIPHGALQDTDVRSDDLSDCFDFSQQPRAFTPIHAPPFIPDAVRGAADEDP